MSHDQRLEYLATTKDEGNKRSVSSCGKCLRKSRANLIVILKIGLTFVLRTKSKRSRRALLERDV